MRSRLLALSLLASVFGAVSLPQLVQAQTAGDYPQHTVRIIVPFPSGGSSDGAARVIAERMSGEWKVPVVVESRVGAGGTIAAAMVAASPPDGYVLYLIGPGTHAVSSALYPNLTYHPTRSFASVSQIGTGPYFVLVNANSPIKSMKDLIDAAKADPGAVTYASSGNGSGGHLLAESLAIATGTRLMHIPYKGAAPATLAVLAGEVNFAISDISAAPFLQSGKLRALAVTTPKRYSQYPDIPTLGEQGLASAEYTISVGLVAPAGTPPDVIAKINATVSRALQDAETRRKLVALGFEPQSSTPEEYGASIASDVDRFGTLVRRIGLKNE